MRTAAAAVKFNDARDITAVGPFLNNLGLGGAQAPPQGGNGGAAQGGIGGAAVNEGYGGGHAPAAGAGHGPCALLAADDVSAVLGAPVKVDNPGIGDECIYGRVNTKVTMGEDATVTLSLNQDYGRLNFDENFRSREKYGVPITLLSGLGDKAYQENECIGTCSDVGVLKGDTFFIITVLLADTDTKEFASRSAVALARKVADRM